MAESSVGGVDGGGREAGFGGVGGTNNNQYATNESNSSTNSSNDPSSILNMVNIATMSDSQFRESLDALLGDNLSSSNTTTNSTTPPPPPHLPVDSVFVPTTLGGSSGNDTSSSSGVNGLTSMNLGTNGNAPFFSFNGGNFSSDCGYALTNTSGTSQPQLMMGLPPYSIVQPSTTMMNSAGCTTMMTQPSMSMMPPPPLMTPPQFAFGPASQTPIANNGGSNTTPSIQTGMFPTASTFVQLGSPQLPGATYCGSSGDGSLNLPLVPPLGNVMVPLQQQQQGCMGQPVFVPPYLESSLASSLPSAVPLLPPPNTASSTAMNSVTADTKSSGKKRSRAKSTTTTAVEDDPAVEFRKRRADRNAREQQRAQQVTDQIAMLRTLLEQSGVSLPKTDKFSTLIMVEQYIRSLQTKSAQLASDHQQLLTAMQQTTEHISKTNRNNNTNSKLQLGSDEGQAPISSSSGSDECSNPSSSSGQDSEEETTPAVKGINYKWIFDCCPFAVAIASIDGRFMDCNKEFEELTQYSRRELLPLEKRSKSRKSSNRRKTNSSKSTEDLSISSSDESSEVNGPPNQVSTATTTTVTAATTATSSDRKDQKCNMSIFNILHRECIERLFCPMSKILQLHNDDYEDDDDDNDSSSDANGEDGDKDTISQEVQLCKRSGRKAKMRVTLVRSSKGLPRFFYCVLLQIPENPIQTSSYCSS